MATGTSFVKASKVEAIVSTPGTGKLTVDGHHYDEFRDVQARQVYVELVILVKLKINFSTKNFLIPLFI
jgi:hypothetical protein